MAEVCRRIRALFRHPWYNNAINWERLCIVGHLNLIATATFGLESLVAEELRKLGCTDTSVDQEQVSFSWDERDICRATLWLRTAGIVK